MKKRQERKRTKMEKKGKTQRPPKKPEKKERTGKLHASIAFSKGKKIVVFVSNFLNYQAKRMRH